jgi:hypothetical protein
MKLKHAGRKLVDKPKFLPLDTRVGLQEESQLQAMAGADAFVRSKQD